jgi:O-antigen/teichoic acid export membrane protein
MGLAITAPITLLASLGLRTVQVTDTKDEFRFGNYMALRLVTSLFSLVLALFITQAMDYHGVALLTILLIALAKAADGIADIIHGALQRRQEMDLIAIAMAVNGVSSLLFMVVLVATTRSVLWGAIGSLAGSLVSLVLVTMPMGARVLSRNERGLARFFVLKPSWNSFAIRQLVIVAFPLGIAYLLTSLTPNVPRYVIGRSLGSDDLGAFAAIASLTAVGPMVMGALYQVMLPRMSLHYDAGDRQMFTYALKRLIAFALAAGLAAVLAAWTIGNLLIPIIFTQEYRANDLLLPLLAIAMSLGFVVWFLDLGLASARRFTIQLPINLATVIFSLGAALMLTPSFGVIGAAWSVCLTACLQCILKGAALMKTIVAMPCEELVKAA